MAYFFPPGQIDLMYSSKIQYYFPHSVRCLWDLTLIWLLLIYFYSIRKNILAYVTQGIDLGLLGTIKTLQFQKPFKIIGKYGENFIFTCTSVQISTQSELHLSDKTFNCAFLYLVCTIKQFIRISADPFFHRVGKQVLNIFLFSSLGFFNYHFYRN